MNRETINAVDGNTLQGWRIVFWSIAGIGIWLVAQACIRILMLIIPTYPVTDFNSSFLGTFIRECTASAGGGYCAMIAHQKYLTYRSRLCTGFVLATVFGGVFAGGGTVIYLILPNDPFPWLDFIWFAVAGIGTLCGIWAGMRSNES